MDVAIESTGRLGRKIYRQLTEIGKSVRAFVKSISALTKVGMRKDYGADTLQGDVQDCASRDAVCQQLCSLSKSFGGLF